MPDFRRSERISISRAVPGMELAKDIYSRSNQVILNAGSILDATRISKIMFYSIDTIWVYPMPGASTAPETLSQQLKNSVEFREFSKRYDETVTVLKDSFVRIMADEGELDEDLLLNEVDTIINESGGKSRIFGMLHCIRDYDELTYMHSVNVAIVSNCFGRWLNMSEDDIRQLTLAGLLHDIGKTAIPKEILLKPEALTVDEYNIVKRHTLLGYDMLKDKSIDDRVKMVALQHHERADGSGYPFGKTAEQLESFSMIVSIADVYDALTCDRVYRSRICPFAVIQSLEGTERLKYNPQYLIPLLANITETYMNHSVRLSDGSVGKIVLMNRSELSKPIVQVDDIFVDLSRERNINIEEII